MFARGAAVIVEPAAARFFEGRVLEDHGKTLDIHQLPEGDAVTVPRARTTPVPTPSTAVPLGLAVCRANAQRWTPCRIAERDGQRQATLLNGHQRTVAPGDVLPPSALTRLHLEMAFEKAESVRRFEAGVRAAGRPIAPSSWSPGPRERLLARRGPVWILATVHELEDEAVRVRWVDTREITELPYGAVVPEPPRGVTPREGAYALMRPRSSKLPWTPVRVERRRDEEYVVIDKGGRRHDVRPRDLVPLSMAVPDQPAP